MNGRQTACKAELSDCATNGPCSGGANGNAVGNDGNHTYGSESDNKMEPIAVIGLALKFPQDATSPESFWQMLLEGRSSMTDIPKNRFNIDAYYHSDPKHVGTVLLFFSS